MNKPIGLSLICLIIVLAGCSNDHKNPTTIPVKHPSFKEMQTGALRLLALIDDDLYLSQVKSIYGPDFEENSQHFNKETQCTEYNVYPYGKTSRPMILGFNKRNLYVYSIDIAFPDPNKRSKILWVKKAQELVYKPWRS